jgi:hypothetical protein
VTRKALILIFALYEFLPGEPSKKIPIARPLSKAFRVAAFGIT